MGLELYMIPIVLFVGLLGMVPVFFPTEKRADPIKNNTKVNAAIQIGYFMWRINMYLPSTNFVSNMKRAVTRNAETLKLHWKQNKNVFEKLYPTIPLELRKKFISDLVKEMKESLECYFEKDEFHMSIVSEFNPHLLICEDEDMHAKTSKNCSTNSDKSVTAKSVACDSNTITSNKTKRSNSKTRTSTKNGSESESDGNLHSTKPDVTIFSIDRLFNETDDVIGSFTQIKVMSSYETEGDLDPTLDSAKKKSVKEDVGLNARVSEFLQTLRALAVVMFLHQFIKRYPLDAKGDPYANTFLYKYLGNRTGKLVEALKTSLGMGCVVLAGMLVLQYFGILDGIFWGMDSSAAQL